MLDIHGAGGFKDQLNWRGGNLSLGCVLTMPLDSQVDMVHWVLRDLSGWPAQGQALPLRVPWLLSRSTGCGAGVLGSSHGAEGRRLPLAAPHPSEGPPIVWSEHLRKALGRGPRHGDCMHPGAPLAAQC